MFSASSIIHISNNSDQVKFQVDLFIAKVSNFMKLDKYNDYRG